MRTETVGSISEFLRGTYAQQEPEKFIVKFERHFAKYGTVYKVAGVTVILITGFDASVFASSGIEVGAERLYMKLLSLGKWVIIFKGGFDTIKHMASGDFDAAKKGFLSYLIVYIFLFGLPWAMDEIDGIFKEMKIDEVSVKR